jgi:hypothetical protein
MERIMIKNRYTGPEFKSGDEVILALGSYQGTLGVFLNLREDPNWADILERTGKVRSHPLAWLAHATPPVEEHRPLDAAA